MPSTSSIFASRPKSLPEAATCEGNSPPQGAGCEQNPCRSLASTLQQNPTNPRIAEAAHPDQSHHSAHEQGCSS